MDARRLIEEAVGAGIVTMSPLAGGCVAEVCRVRLDDGRDLAVKVERGRDPGLDLEAAMLGVLAAHAPAPGVAASTPRVLAMAFVENGGGSTTDGERRLAEIAATLHGVAGPAYGFGTDTRIGPVRLENGWDDDWARFYVEKRLRPLAASAEGRGALPRGLMRLLEEFAGRAAEILDGASGPGLVHGDLWAGNVLWKDGAPAALIDPSTVYADPEFELAFIDLMGGVSGAFWERYAELRPIRAGFWERRAPAYQVFPLVVHAALFGGGYGERAEAALTRALAG